MDEYEDSYVQYGEEDDDELFDQEAVIDLNNPNKDERLKFITIEEKQDLWVFLACLLYVPHRSLDELGKSTESWWEAFKRLGPRMSDTTKLQLILIIEMKRCPETRHKENAKRAEEQVIATQEQTFESIGIHFPQADLTQR